MGECVTNARFTQRRFEARNPQEPGLQILRLRTSRFHPVAINPAPILMSLASEPGPGAGSELTVITAVRRGGGESHDRGTAGAD